jgi:hypothetical protein
MTIEPLAEVLHRFENFSAFWGLNLLVNISSPKLVRLEATERMPHQSKMSKDV